MRRYFGKPTNITPIFMKVFQPSTISPPHSPTHTYTQMLWQVPNSLTWLTETQFKTSLPRYQTSVDSDVNERASTEVQFTCQNGFDLVSDEITLWTVYSFFLYTNKLLTLFTKHCLMLSNHSCTWPITRVEKGTDHGSRPNIAISKQNWPPHNLWN
jgi:hypothetical protein